MKKVDWDSIGVVVFLLITFICKLFSCVLHGVYAFQDGRRGLSTFKNRPFSPQEGRFQRARRAYTRTQNITRWFLVGYILGCRRWYMRILRVVSLVGCKDFSSFCWLLSGREVVWEVMPVGLLTFFVGSFFSHWTHRFNRTFSTNVSNPQDSGPSPNPSPAGRGVVCEVTPIGLLVWGVGRFFFHAGDFFLSQSARRSRRF